MQLAISLHMNPRNAIVTDRNKGISLRFYDSQKYYYGMTQQDHPHKTRRMRRGDSSCSMYPPAPSLMTT